MVQGEMPAVEAATASQRVCVCSAHRLFVRHIILLSTIRPMNRQQTRAPRNVSSTPCRGEFYRPVCFRLIFFHQHAPVCAFSTTFVSTAFCFVKFCHITKTSPVVAFLKGSQMTPIEMRTLIIFQMLFIFNKNHTVPFENNVFDCCPEQYLRLTIQFEGDSKAFN
jgi:hypothetical protein